MSDSIKVAIRVRPLIKREKDENLPIQWVSQGNAIVAVDAEIKRRGDGRFQFGMIRANFDVTCKCITFVILCQNIFLENNRTVSVTLDSFLSACFHSFHFLVFFSLILKCTLLCASYLIM